MLNRKPTQPSWTYNIPYDFTSIVNDIIMADESDVDNNNNIYSNNQQKTDEWVIIFNRDKNDRQRVMDGLRGRYRKGDSSVHEDLQQPTIFLKRCDAQDLVCVITSASYLSLYGGTKLTSDQSHYKGTIHVLDNEAKNNLEAQIQAEKKLPYNYPTSFHNVVKELIKDCKKFDVNTRVAEEHAKLVKTKSTKNSASSVQTKPTKSTQNTVESTDIQSPKRKRNQKIMTPSTEIKQPSEDIILPTCRAKPITLTNGMKRSSYNNNQSFELNPVLCEQQVLLDDFMPASHFEENLLFLPPVKRLIALSEKAITMDLITSISIIQKTEPFRFSQSSIKTEDVKNTRNAKNAKNQSTTDILNLSILPTELATKINTNLQALRKIRNYDQLHQAKPLLIELQILLNESWNFERIQNKSQLNTLAICDHFETVIDQLLNIHEGYCASVDLENEDKKFQKDEENKEKNESIDLTNLIEEENYQSKLRWVDYEDGTCTRQEHTYAKLYLPNHSTFFVKPKTRSLEAYDKNKIPSNPLAYHYAITARIRRDLLQIEEVINFNYNLCKEFIVFIDKPTKASILQNAKEDANKENLKTNSLRESNNNSMVRLFDSNNNNSRSTRQVKPKNQHANRIP
ncbi:MAG: hypothetical protein H0W64_01785 [Gammaproteobacteria bacterium]|nr:hypothetical protein [Gammaproteobacteria bacterium]